MIVISSAKFERRSLLSAFETIQVIIAIGSYSIALVALVVKLLKNDEKK